MKKAKKSLSQNFIIDKNVCKKIISESNVRNKIVLEIGPGYGFLTDYILKNNPKKIILVEKDSYLIETLHKKYSKNDKIEIFEEDILNFNLEDYKNLIIISNLPYNISTKIILNLFKYHCNIIEMVLMVQKEVALKFDYNLPNMNKYKFLTKVVSNFSICFNVSSKVFIPKPKVKSSVVKFIFKKNSIEYDKAKEFSNLIFRNVRKKIYNNINLKRKNNLLEKRVNQLSINELLTIYDLV